MHSIFFYGIHVCPCIWINASSKPGTMTPSLKVSKDFHAKIDLALEK